MTAPAVAATQPAAPRGGRLTAPGGPFAYHRLREPPYSEDDLRALADRIRAAAVPAYVYFRHEDEPTAPAYALRLRALLSA